MKAIVRLYEYLELKSIKPTALEKVIGLSNGYLGTQKKRNADMGEAIIIKIINYCRDLSLIWLITGDGEMLKNTINECSAKTKVLYENDPKDAEILAANKDTIETQKKLIISLERRIKELESGSSYSKASGFRSVPSVDTSNPSQTREKAK